MSGLDRSVRREAPHGRPGAGCSAGRVPAASVTRMPSAAASSVALCRSPAPHRSSASMIARSKAAPITLAIGLKEVHVVAREAAIATIGGDEHAVRARASRESRRPHRRPCLRAHETHRWPARTAAVAVDGAGAALGTEHTAGIGRAIRRALVSPGLARVPIPRRRASTSWPVAQLEHRRRPTPAGCSSVMLIAWSMQPAGNRCRRAHAGRATRSTACCRARTPASMLGAPARVDVVGHDERARGAALLVGQAAQRRFDEHRIARWTDDLRVTAPVASRGEGGVKVAASRRRQPVGDQRGDRLPDARPCRSDRRAIRPPVFQLVTRPSTSATTMASVTCERTCACIA